MAAFADFLDLRTAVIEHVGNAGIADVFPRLVEIAESRLDRELRMRQQITTQTLTVAGELLTLPATFAEMIGVYDALGREYLGYDVQDATVTMASVEGAVSVKFYARIPTLTSSVTTSNWLLARYPDVYLYAVGFEAAKYIRNAELAVQTKGLLDEALFSARADDERARYARTRVRVAGVTP